MTCQTACATHRVHSCEISTSVEKIRRHLRMPLPHRQNYGWGAFSILSIEINLVAQGELGHGLYIASFGGLEKPFFDVTEKGYDVAGAQIASDLERALAVLETTKLSDTEKITPTRSECEHTEFFLRVFAPASRRVLTFVKFFDLAAIIMAVSPA